MKSFENKINGSVKILAFLNKNKAEKIWGVNGQNGGRSVHRLSDGRIAERVWSNNSPTDECTIYINAETARVNYVSVDAPNGY